MPIGRRDAPPRLLRLAAWLLTVGAAAACHACASLARGAQSHPIALAGLWTDAARSTPGDTTYWRLAPDGTFRPFRQRATAGGAVVSDERYAPRHGDWYVRGALADTARRVLCVHNSRIAAYCAGFSLDTTASGTRRLRVWESRGAFVVPARTLVARP